MLCITANGNIYDGQWRNGVKHGEGVYVFKDKGQFMEGVWIDGVSTFSIIKHLSDLDAVSVSISMEKQRTTTHEVSIIIIRHNVYIKNHRIQLF